MPNVLVAALTSCAEIPYRSRTRRFLDGLSGDELQFLAEFYGACIVEGGRVERDVEAKMAGRCAHRRSWDHDHKLILLHEYLARAGASRTVTSECSLPERLPVRVQRRPRRPAR